MSTDPDFILIGAAKSGTSALYHFLRQHPQVFMSVNKEPNYFALQSQTLAFAGPGDVGINQRSVTTREAYEALFAGKQPGQLSGEASTLYLYHEAAPAHIRRQRPDAKLIAILRNPTDRAFSSFLHTRRDSREPLADFSAALAAEPERIAANWSHLWHYQRAGHYAEQVERYLEQFPREQLLFLLYDDLAADPQRVLLKIYGFLGISDQVDIDTDRRYNASGQARSARLQTWIVRPNPLKTWVRRFLPDDLRLGIMQSLQEFNVSRNGSPKMTDSERAFLDAQFQDERGRLESLIGRDLSAWEQAEAGT